MRVGPIGDSRLHVVEGLGVEQIDAVVRKAACDERRMRVVEARQDRHATRIDHRGLRSAIPEDLPVGADM